MEHVVFFPAHDGSPAFRRVATLQDAVRLVEHLRNIEGVNEVSVHSLQEVPMAFKPYYKVEIPGVEEVPAAPPAPAVAAAPVVPEPIAVAAPELAAVPSPLPLAVAVPEQGDAPVESAAEQAVEPAVEEERAPSAASLGFFAH